MIELLNPADAPLTETTFAIVYDCLLFQTVTLWSAAGVLDYRLQVAYRCPAPAPYGRYEETRSISTSDSLFQRAVNSLSSDVRQRGFPQKAIDTLIPVGVGATCTGAENTLTDRPITMPIAAPTITSDRWCTFSSIRPRAVKTPSP